MSVLRERLTAQRLAGRPAGDPVQVAQQLLAIQAQDPRGARLAIRARTRGVTAADVDRALTVERSLVLTWLNRGTLHLVTAEDYPWLHALTTPQLLAQSHRRLAQEGVNPGNARRAVKVIERSLADEGPLTRTALGDRLLSADIPLERGQALIHVLFRASLEGVVVRGPMLGRQHAYVLVRDWLPAFQPGDQDHDRDRDRALGELARRYLAGHWPADERDLARWAGLPIGEARRGLQAIASELTQRPGGLVEPAGRPRAARLPAPRLLGAFEPVLLGWRSRADVLGRHEPRVVTGGMFRGFAMAGGRAVAGWRLNAGAIEIEPFDELDSGVASGLERDAGAVRSFLGLSAG